MLVTTNPQKWSLHHKTEDLEPRAPAAYTRLTRLHLELPRGPNGESVTAEKTEPIFSEVFGP